jgi:guanylate kinase
VESAQTGQTNRPQYGLMVVSAPSGAGKSTLCTQLLRELPHRIELSISSTSRAPRGTEQHGKEYYFLPKDDFMEQINAGEFAEWALVHGNYYGTSKKSLEKFWGARRHVLLDIDVQGAASLRQQYPERTLTVFIAPPSLEELEKRLRGRGTDSEEAIQKRMKNAQDELARQGEFDLVIINDVYAEAYERLKTATIDFMDRMERGSWQKRP